MRCGLFPSLNMLPMIGIGYGPGGSRAELPDFGLNHFEKMYKNEKRESKMKSIVEYISVCTKLCEPCIDIYTG